MPFNKTGPLTEQELFELWRSVVDPEYASPLLTNPESGIELIEQTAAQLAATSRAVDQTFQSLYILPWSGQTNPPASGAVKAVVALQVTRTGRGALSADLPILFQVGLAFDHAPDDYSDEGSMQVTTGRRYLAVDYAVLPGGQLGPVTVVAASEGWAAGYNLPLPGTIRVLDQLGSGLSNAGASVIPTTWTNRLVLSPEPEVLTPDQIGQYLQFTAGANAGQIVRMVGYEPATPGNGGTAILASEGWLVITGVAGTFIPGEALELPVVGATAILLWTDGVTRALVSWPAATTLGVMTGVLSGATATISSIERSTLLTAESGTAEWRVLDWVTDFGIEVTNPENPSGGQTPTLDAIGYERRILRSRDEPDDQYRERVAAPVDVVSPNAIRRAVNRVLAPLDIPWCFREVGRPNFRGLFFDGDPNSTNPAVAFAFDLDFDVVPADRYKLLLDYTEFRAFFLICVPRLTTGEFGTAFDDHPAGFFDAAPALSFFDGSPVGEGKTYKQVHDAVSEVIAGGVGFAIVPDDGPCD